MQMSLKNNWVVLNACGFSAGAASSLLILYLTQWVSSSVLLLISFLSFGLSIGIFQCLSFKSHKRLVFRWLLANSTLSLIGFLVSASGLMSIFIILFFEFASSFATIILFVISGAFVFALTGFLISNGQTIAARDHIHRARSWVWNSTLAFAASGAIICPLLLLGIFIIPYKLSMSLAFPLWGALSGLPSGAIFGLITKSRSIELITSVRSVAESNR